MGGGEGVGPFVRLFRCSVIALFVCSMATVDEVGLLYIDRCDAMAIRVALAIVQRQTWWRNARLGNIVRFSRGFVEFLLHGLRIAPPIPPGDSFVVMLGLLTCAIQDRAVCRL